MKRKLFNFLILTIFCSIPIFSQDTYIQVVSESGISVFLDGKFKGKTSLDMEGLIIELNKGGDYTIKVVKEGYSPQKEKISVNNGEVRIYKVRPFIPSVRIRQKGNQDNQTIELKSGDLKIQSIPVAIKISIPDLGISSGKTEDEWYAEGIPEGTYGTSFSLNNKVYKEQIKIADQKLTSLLIDLRTGKITYRADNNKAIDRQEEVQLIREEQYRIERERQRLEEERLKKEEQADKLNKLGRNTYGRQGVGEEERSQEYSGGEGNYGLGGRKVVGELPNPNIDNCNVTSRVIMTVEIQVDRSGNVLSANVQSATYADNCIWNVVIQAAKNTKFTSDQNAAFKQTGWIKYTIEP